MLSEELENVKRSRRIRVTFGERERKGFIEKEGGEVR